MERRNDFSNKLFQIGLVLIIPGVSYIYAQGVSSSGLESLNATIGELHVTVKELTMTTNQLYNSTTVLTTETKHQQLQLEKLQRDTEANRLDIAALKERLRDGH